MTGQEYLHTLESGSTHQDAGELLDMEVEAVEQPGGEVLLYPVDRSLSVDGNPILIHVPHPERTD